MVARPVGFTNRPVDVEGGGSYVTRAVEGIVVLSSRVEESALE